MIRIIEKQSLFELEFIAGHHFFLFKYSLNMPQIDCLQNIFYYIEWSHFYLFYDNYRILTSRRKVIYGWPMAWQSPMLARMTSLNGFFTP